MRISSVSHYLIGLLIFLSIYSPGQTQTDPSKNNKPNIVLILVDDSGLMDFGAFGGEARTPNIDRLAKTGMMFTNMHASPVCAPSRAMLITGSDSHLAGVANLPEMLSEEFQNKPGYEGVLNDRVQTIATRLKEVNYNTYATGKWHLGHDEKTLPSKRGFDRSFILGGSGASNYDSKGYLPMKPVAHWYEDGEEVELPDDFYSSKDYIDKTISFHKEEKQNENPFFSYIAFQAIHAPIQAPEEFVETYKETYNEGWDVLRQNRFEKAKQLGFIPESARLNNIFPNPVKWEELSAKKQQKYISSMAVTAGMLEAMDYHIGRYLDYLSDNELMDNTIFIITSDNGPDGADFKLGMPWALSHGYHRNFDKKGGKNYFGYIGQEFANALASPFSYFKYYTGEGGLRVPLIISGRNIPKQKTSSTFTFFTDIAPTIYDLAGISTSANPGFAPITGKSLLPHIKDSSKTVYESTDGVGLEAANSSAYFLNGYKIVKNNIPLGDNQWHLHHLVTDPGETKDLAQKKPELFQKMLAAYEEYEKTVGVIKMPAGYSASGTVTKKSSIQILKNILPWLIAILLILLGFIVWRKRKT